MKKNIIYLLGLGAIFSFLFTSCGKEPSVENPQGNKLVQLAEFKSDDEITRFEYNSDSSLSKIIFSEDPVSLDQNITYSVKYLANKKVDELVGSNGTIIKLSYVNNILTKSDVSVGPVKISSSYYNYTGGQLSSTAISMFYANPNIGTPALRFDFVTSSSNNVNKIKLQVFNPTNNQYQEESYVNFQYDDKMNPFASVGDLMLIFWQYANKNNITRQENIDPGGDVLELVETTYTYNAQNYPTKATVKVTEANEQPTISQLSYTYR